MDETQQKCVFVGIIAYISLLWLLLFGPRIELGRFMKEARLSADRCMASTFGKLSVNTKVFVGHALGWRIQRNNSLDFFRILLFMVHKIIKFLALNLFVVPFIIYVRKLKAKAIV